MFRAAGGVSTREVPFKAGGIFRRFVAELHGERRTAFANTGAEAGRRRRHDTYRLGGGHTAALVGGGEGHFVLAVFGVGVRRILFRAAVAVAKVPLVAGGVGGGVGKAGLQTVGAGGEARLWHVVYDDVIREGIAVAAGGIADGERHGVNAGLFVNDGRVLFRAAGGVSAGEVPFKAGGIFRRFVAELHGERRTAFGNSGTEAGRWNGHDGHLLGGGVIATVVGGDEHYRVNPILTVNVGRVFFGAGAAVAKVPRVAVGVGRTVAEADGVQVYRRGEPGRRHGGHRDVIGFGYRAAACGVGHGQCHGVAARLIVGHGRVFFRAAGRVAAGEVPIEAGGILRRFIAELHGERCTTLCAVGAEACRWQCHDGHRLGHGIGPAGIGGNEHDGVGSVFGVDVGRVFFGAGAAVAEVPRVAVGVGRTVAEADGVQVYRRGEPGRRHGGHRDVIGFGYRAAACGVGHGQCHGVAARLIVGHDRVFIGTAGGVATGEVPLKCGRIFRRFIAELHGERRTTRGGIGAEARRGWRHNGHGLGGAHAVAVVDGGQRHGVGSVGSVSVGGVLVGAVAAVAKIPVVAVGKLRAVGETDAKAVNRCCEARNGHFENGDVIFHQQRVGAGAVADDQGYIIGAGAVVVDRRVGVGAGGRIPSGKIPYIADCIFRRITVEHHFQGGAAFKGVGREAGSGRHYNCDVLGGRGRAAVIGSGQCHLVGSVSCIGMRGVFNVAGVAVAKIPNITEGIGRSVVESNGVAVYGEVKIRCWNGVHRDVIGPGHGIGTRRVADDQRYGIDPRSRIGYRWVGVGGNSG